MEETDHKACKFKSLITYIIRRLDPVAVYIKKPVFIAAALVPIVMLSMSMYDRYYKWVTLKHTPMIKFPSGKNILYHTNIKNDSPTHAEDITFKAEFKNGTVKYIKVTPNIDIPPNDINYGNPKELATFSMKRLSRGNGTCSIDINVKAEGQVEEDIQVSGKNVNPFPIIPELAGEESQQQFKSISDFNSYNAREKWLKRNNKGINK